MAKNDIVNYGEYMKILLKDKNGSVVGQALIDKEDYDKVKDIRWHKTNSGYAIGYKEETGDKFLMHTFLKGFKEGYIIDHINRNRLDNRKSNLRHTTYSENSLNSSLNKNNTSGVKGVSFNKNTQKWKAYIEIESIRYNLGEFKEFERAVQARQQKEIELIGFLLEY